MGYRVVLSPSGGGEISVTLYYFESGGGSTGNKKFINRIVTKDFAASQISSFVIH